MLKHIDHVGIAVPDLNAALETWRRMGLADVEIEEIPDQGVRVAMLPLGEGKIELLEPLSEESPVARFLARKGPGIHHVAFRVADIEEALQTAKEQGFELIDTVPRRGAGGARIAFLHPRSVDGTLVELCQR